MIEMKEKIPSKREKKKIQKRKLVENFSRKHFVFMLQHTALKLRGSTITVQLVIYIELAKNQNVSVYFRYSNTVKRTGFGWHTISLTMETK